MYDNTRARAHTHTHTYPLYYYYTISPCCSVIVPTIYTFSIIIYLSSDDPRIPSCVYLLSHLPQTLTIYVHIKPRNLCDGVYVFLYRTDGNDDALWSHSQKIGSQRPPPPRGLQIVFESERATENTILIHIFIVSPVHWFINLERVFVLYKYIIIIYSQTRNRIIYYILLVLCVCMESLNVISTRLTHLVVRGYIFNSNNLI